MEEKISMCRQSVWVIIKFGTGIHSTNSFIYPTNTYGVFNSAMYCLKAWDYRDKENKVSDHIKLPF